MKRIWKLAIIAGIVLIIAGLLATKMNPDSGWKMGTSGMDASEVSDSCDSVRSEIRDTAALVVHDTAQILRDEMIDSAAIVAHDTAQILRVEMIDSAEIVVHDTAQVLRAEIPDTLTANAIREIAGRFALALGLGSRDTFFITYGASSADTTFFLETGDSTLMWSNTPNPFRIGSSGAIQVAADGKVILGVNGFHINTDADSVYLSKYAILGFIGDTAVVVRSNIGDSIRQGQWIIKDYIDTTISDVPFDDAYRVTTAVADSLLSTVRHASKVAGDSIRQAQWIIKDYVDTTSSNIPFDGAFHITTAEADSAYITQGTFDLIADDTTGWAKKATDETISGQWEHSDTLEMTGTRPIAWINTGNDTGRVWMDDNDTLYMQATTGKIKVGSSMIVNAAGDVVATGGMDIAAKVSADAFHVEDTTEADSALITTYTGQLLIEDSLGEYTLLTDFGKVTDDTTNYQSAYSMTSGATTQWVTGAMIDSTANTVIFSAASHVTSAEADSAYVSKGYVDAHDVTNDVYVWAYLTTADQAIAYNTWTQVAFNAENMDLSSDFNTTTNEFTAPDSGFYVIGARANIQDNGGATNQGGSLIAIYRNDSMMVRGTKLIGFNFDTDVTDASCGPTVSATLYCPVSATIQIYAYQDFQDAGGGLIKQTAEETWITIRKVN